jgi:hypothetical protein
MKDVDPKYLAELEAEAALIVLADGREQDLNLVVAALYIRDLYRAEKALDTLAEEV